MKQNVFFLLALLAAFALCLSVIIACDDDDDDDDATGDDDDVADDDDATGDDDSGGFQNAKDACVEFMMDCLGIPESAAEFSCSFINDYEDDWNECLDAAYGEYYDCLSAADCDLGAIETCATEVSNAAEDCI